MTSFIKPTLNAQRARLTGSMGSGTDLGKTTGSRLVSLIQFAGIAGADVPAEPTAGPFVRILSLELGAGSRELSAERAFLPENPEGAKPRVWAGTACVSRSNPKAIKATQRQFPAFARARASRHTPRWENWRRCPRSFGFELGADLNANLPLVPISPVCRRNESEARRVCERANSPTAQNSATV